MSSKKKVKKKEVVSHFEAGVGGTAQPADEAVEASPAWERGTAVQLFCLLGRPELNELCHLDLYYFEIEFEFEGRWFQSGGLKNEISGCEKDGGSLAPHGGAPWAAPWDTPWATPWAAWPSWKAEWSSRTCPARRVRAGELGMCRCLLELRERRGLSHMHKKKGSFGIGRPERGKTPIWAGGSSCGGSPYASSLGAASA